MKGYLPYILFFLFILIFISVNYSISKYRKIEVKRRNGEDEKLPFHLILILSVALVLTMVIIYFPVQALIDKYYTYGKDSTIDLFEKSSTVLITTVSVIITAIFSYLIYIATERGLEIARVMKNIEQERDKEERVKKYNETDGIPQVQLLMTIDYLLYHIEKIKIDLYNEFGNSEITLAEALSEGRLAASFSEKYSNMISELQNRKNSFLPILYLSSINFTGEENLNIDIEPIIKPYRLKALFDSPEVVINEVMERLWDLLSLNEGLDKMKQSRNEIVNMLEEELNSVFKGLINSETLGILHEPAQAHLKIWSVLGN